jgi:hypothetical protein
MDPETKETVAEEKQGSTPSLSRNGQAGTEIQVKRYRIKRMYWKQEELTYGEFIEVFRLFRGRFETFSSNAEKFGAFVDKMVDDRVMPEFISIALKPDSGNPAKRFINVVLMRRGKVERKNLVEHMVARQIAEAVKDFFLINLSWIDSFMNSKIGLGGSSRTVTLQDLAFLLTSIFTSPQTETTKEQNSSAESQSAFLLTSIFTSPQTETTKEQNSSAESQSQESSSGSP